MASIALLGVTGFRNRGVEALTRPVADFILKRSESDSIRIFSWSADHDQNRIDDARITFVPTAFRRLPATSPSRSRREQLKQMLKGELPSRKSTKEQAGLVDLLLVSQLQESRMAIITGGDVYSSEYGHDSLLYYCSLIQSAKAAGLPVVLLGHTIGRFSTQEDEQVWRQSAKLIDLLTTRDQLTFDYLSQIDGLAAQTEVCADVAFGLAPADQIPAYRFPDPSLPCIAISISKGLHRWCALSADEHLAAWLQLVAHFLETWKVNVLIIPHVQEAYGDDRQLATNLHRATGFDPRIWVAAEDLMASEYKKLVGSCQLVIAERMHAAIAGLSTQVPTVMVSYSLKVEGIAALAYGTLDSGPSSMVIAANTLQNPAEALRQLSEIWQQRDTVQNCLADTIPEIQASAAKNFYHLGSLMDRLAIA